MNPGVPKIAPAFLFAPLTDALVRIALSFERHLQQSGQQPCTPCPKKKETL